MTRSGIVELGILGPLEARHGGELLALGGAKQRAVLASLLLRPGVVVPAAQLVDEIWGDAPPATADHNLVVYVSRLRSTLDGAPSIVRQGAGYVLELGEATLDTTTFLRAADEAAQAAAGADHERVRLASAEALACWRGPVAADVELGPLARGDADRLEEARLRTLELRVDAELALGNHAAVVGELQTLVGEHPFRERFVAQLMLALYRCGRHAEALEVYERIRRLLDDELGLQPSAELQQLSARIVRQEPELAPPPSSRGAPSARAGSRGRRRGRRATTLVYAGIAAAVALVLTASGSASDPSQPPAAETFRVALVLPTDPRASELSESTNHDRFHATQQAFLVARYLHELETETLTVDEVAPDAADIDRLMGQIDQGEYDLVLLQGDRASARLVAPRVASRHGTQFVFIDTSLAQLSLEGVRNATAVRFALEDPAQLAGYAAGLRARLAVAPYDRFDLVSVVAGVPDLESRRVVASFRRGVRAAAPSLPIRVDYAGETQDTTPCERLADEQINAGSDLVAVVAGRCGLGAAAVARARSVPVIGEDEYGISEQPWVFMSMFKDYSRVPGDILSAFRAGTLPAGEDVVLGLEDDYAVGTSMGVTVPAMVQSKVVRLCSRLREHAEQLAQ